jgi:pyruvate dehydrogenase E2 component (dihydrolipoamide acetyltransferase)
MAQSVLCPQVGQDLSEAKVVALHVKLGDTVKKGDIVAEVESEKASFEVEAFSSGIVIGLPYKVGDNATVLEPLVVLGMAGEAIASEPLSTATEKNIPIADKAITLSNVLPHKAASADSIVRSSPLARRTAIEAGIDFSTLVGTGPRGAIVLRDVEEALASGLQKQRKAPAEAGRSKLTIKSLKNGTGDPVIFIHGFGSDLSSWRPFVPKLSIDNPLIGIDLPGHGASVDETIENFDSMVTEVAASLLASGHNRVHIVGHSMGAAVAASLSRVDAVDVRSMTLLAPAGIGPRIDGSFVEGYLSAQTEVALSQWMKRLVYAPHALPPAFLRATLGARTGTGLTGAQSAVAHAVFEGSTQLFSVVDALYQYQGPCRVIVGRRDMVIPAEQADALPGNVAVNRLDFVGHLPHVEAAGLVARLVAETIRSAD